MKTPVEWLANWDRVEPNHDALAWPAVRDQHPYRASFQKLITIGRTASLRPAGSEVDEVTGLRPAQCQNL
jgi:hypothetical protein